MDEAEQLCDHLVVMDKAQIVAEGSPRQLIDEHSTKEVLELRVTDTCATAWTASSTGLADRIEALPTGSSSIPPDGERTLEQVNQRQIPIESALVRRSSLEDVFLRLTGRSLVE